MENHFASNLKILRESRHYSQVEMAKKLKADRRLVNAFELGTSSPKLPHLIEISEIYEISLDDLVFKKIKVSINYSLEKY